MDFRGVNTEQHTGRRTGGTAEGSSAIAFVLVIVSCSLTEALLMGFGLCIDK